MSILNQNYGKFCVCSPLLLKRNGVTNTFSSFNYVPKYTMVAILSYKFPVAVFMVSFEQSTVHNVSSSLRISMLPE